MKLFMMTTVCELADIKLFIYISPKYKLYSYLDI